MGNPRNQLSAALLATLSVSLAVAATAAFTPIATSTVNLPGPVCAAYIGTASITMLDTATNSIIGSITLAMSSVSSCMFALLARRGDRHSRPRDGARGCQAWERCVLGPKVIAKHASDKERRLNGQRAAAAGLDDLKRSIPESVDDGSQ